MPVTPLSKHSRLRLKETMTQLLWRPWIVALGAIISVSAINLGLFWTHIFPNTAIFFLVLIASALILTTTAVTIERISTKAMHMPSSHAAAFSSPSLNRTFSSPERESIPHFGDSPVQTP